MPPALAPFCCSVNGYIRCWRCRACHRSYRTPCLSPCSSPWFLRPLFGRGLAMGVTARGGGKGGASPRRSRRIACRVAATRGGGAARKMRRGGRGGRQAARRRVAAASTAKITQKSAYPSLPYLVQALVYADTCKQDACTGGALLLAYLLLLPPRRLSELQATCYPPYGDMSGNQRRGCGRWRTAFSNL